MPTFYGYRSHGALSSCTRTLSTLYLRRNELGQDQKTDNIDRRLLILYIYYAGPEGIGTLAECVMHGMPVRTLDLRDNGLLSKGEKLKKNRFTVIVS